MEPDIAVMKNQKGGFVDVYIDYFEECIEYAYQNKVPQIHITRAWRKENKNAQVDFKKLERLSGFLQNIAFQTALENVINTEAIYTLENLNEISGETQKFAIDLSKFENLKHFGGEYWKGLLIDKAYSLTSAVLIKLPDTDMKRIAGLKNLETLHVYRSKIQSLDGIQNLPLKNLRLVSCNSLEDIEAIRELKVLERLSVEKCKKVIGHEIIEETERKIKTSENKKAETNSTPESKGKTYKLQTDLFGEIEVFQKEEYTDKDSPIVHYKKYTLIFDGKEKDINLCLFNVLSDSNLKVIQDMLNNVFGLYEKGKEALFSGKDSNEVIKYFIDFHIKEIDEIHEIFDVDSNDKISTEMFMEKLFPKAISISVNEDNILDCSLDFSIQGDYTDELLVVCFNSQHEVYDIKHES